MVSWPKVCKIILIVGASGIIGRALVRSLGSHEDLKLIAASRRPETDLPTNTVPLRIDLCDWEEGDTGLVNDVTHLVYCAYVDAQGWERQREPNNVLFRNSLELVIDNLDGRQFLHAYYLLS